MKEINAAQAAKRLQRELDPILTEMRETVFKQIQNSNFFQKKDRENCYKMLRAIELFESRLRKRISSGAVAESKLKLAR